MKNSTIAEAVRTVCGQRLATLKLLVVSGDKIEITLAYRDRQIRNPQPIVIGIAEWVEMLARHMSRTDGYGHYTGLDTYTIDGVTYTPVEQ